MESLGLTGVLACVSPLWSCTVKVPENTKTHRETFRRTLSNPRHDKTPLWGIEDESKVLLQYFPIRIIEM